MEKQEAQNNGRMLAIAFFVLFGAVLAFVIGQRLGGSLDRHGRNVTIAHDHAVSSPQAGTPAPTAAPVAQK